MPTLIKVNCHNCHNKFSVTLKRFNESTKNNWKFFCSQLCLRKDRYTSVEVICQNPVCNKKFSRRPSYLNANATNFCCQGCAATVNNTKRKGKYIYHVNKNLIAKADKSIYKIKSTAQFTYCKNPTCRKQIPISKTYCSNICQGDHLRIPIEKRKEDILKRIKEFVAKENRIPLKIELGNMYPKAYRAFGTWNNAISAAGFDTNPVLFAKKHIAKDGHKCDSFAEMIIDDWLYIKGIPHQVHMPYPLQKRFKSDFLIGNIYIEFFGLEGQVHQYDAHMKRKLALIKKQKLNVIMLRPKDLFPHNNLDEVLYPLLVEQILVPALPMVLTSET